MTQKLSKKNIFLWGLYDFANTPLTSAIGGMFLAQWIVLDNKFEDIWYGITFTLSTILLLLTSPFWGAWSDKIGKRMPFIKWTTIIIILTGIAMSFMATSSLPRIPKVISVLVLFFILQYFYQISLIFYNALLNKISTPETRGKVSGIGDAFSEISWLFSNVMLLPFSMGLITLFGQAGRGQVFLPATIALIIFGLPMLLWLKEDKSKVSKTPINFSSIFYQTLNGFKSLLKEDKNIAIFLVGFMFVSDALLTASLYFAIYLDQIFRINDTQKVILVAILEIVATISSLVFSKISDKIGIKKILVFACFNLTLVYAAISLTSSLPFMYFLSALIGVGYGGFYTASRGLLAKLSPPSKLGEYFGIYSTFQKFASILGPLLWGAVILLLKNYDLLRYRVGILSLSVLMFIGTIILIKVKDIKARLVL